MKELEDGRIRCRVRIKGRYQGRPFTYVDPRDHEGSQFIDTNGDPSTWWWSMGNMGCDCNRHQFLPEDLRRHHSGSCGNHILIDIVEPIDYEGPTLELMETEA